MQKIKVKNKWNGRIYLAEFKDKEVKMLRDDNTEFTIPLTEFKFNYIKLGEKNGKKN